MSRDADALMAFRQKHPKRPPAADRITHLDQVRRLTQTEGVRYLDVAPVSDVMPGHPPSEERAGNACHLWVFDEAGVPFIFEHAPVAHELNDRAIKHTNLTGGDSAYCGGEVWFAAATTNQVFVSGASGRYRPRAAEELEDAIAVFRDFGFKTTSLGWDPQTNAPQRVLRPDE